MLDLARNGAAEGLWLRAARQTVGRGRLGRVWDSPAGNAYASTLVRLRTGDPTAATLALVAAVALAEAVGIYLVLGDGPGTDERAAGTQRGAVQRGPRSAGIRSRRGTLELKWPNDLLLDGAKLSGILLERAGDAVVIGIGVNLAHHPAIPERPTTSLAAHDVRVSPEDVIGTLADGVARWLSRWRSEGLAPVRQRWLELAHPVGTALAARLPDGGAVEGLFDGLDADGALILRLADGSRRVIHAGDVFLI